MCIPSFLQTHHKSSWKYSSTSSFISIIFLSPQHWCVQCSMHHKTGQSAACQVKSQVACVHFPVTLDLLWLAPPIVSAAQRPSGQAHPHSVGHYSVFPLNPLKMESFWLHVAGTTHHHALSCVHLVIQLMDQLCKHVSLILRLVQYSGQNHQCVMVSFFPLVGMYTHCEHLLFRKCINDCKLKFSM